MFLTVRFKLIEDIVDDFVISIEYLCLLVLCDGNANLIQFLSRLSLSYTSAFQLDTRLDAVLVGLILSE